ncbi:MAG TPA: hypothetical protein VJL81_15225 [Solirubrobacterales bacterium]|nr:hypothetical protein [Solirubrobacterales bacterium]
MSRDEQDRAAQDAAAGDALEQEVVAAEAAATGGTPAPDAAAGATPGQEVTAAGASAAAGAAAGSAPSQSATATDAPSQGAPGPTEPDDANDLRGYYFRQLLHKPLTWVLVGGGSLLVGVILVLALSPVIGVIAFVALFLIGIWLTFNLADSRAADSFFDVYAKKHDLILGGKTSLPPTTPLLRKGDDQYADRTLTGELAPGVGGLLAIYTYVTESTDSNGNREKTYHPFTLGMTDVPECVAHVPELYCQRKSGLRSLEKFEDVFRKSKERVQLESEALADRYEIFAAKGQDPVWLRRLFSPTFIVWLTEEAPEKFAFELVGGTLVAYVPKHHEDTASLDKVGAATGMVASRLREKSAETSPAAD